MNAESEGRGEDFGRIAEKSRRTVLYIQAAEGILIVGAFIGLVIMLSLLFSQKHRIDLQQNTIAAQQTTILAQQHQLATEEKAQSSETKTVRQALCDSQFTIATAPLSPQSTKLGVDIIESYRKGFIVLGCVGRLGPPPKELLKLGAEFGVPIRY